MSIAAKIRDRLTKNPDLDVAKLAEKLETTKQHVYQVRHEMKKERLQAETDSPQPVRTIRAKNEKTLATYILELLNITPYGLSADAIASLVQTAGYVTHSNNFQEVLRQRLYAMVNKKSIKKDGDLYSHPSPTKTELSTVPDVSLHPEGDAVVIPALLFKLVDLSKQYGIATLQTHLNVVTSLEEVYNV